MTKTKTQRFMQHWIECVSGPGDMKCEIYSPGYRVMVGRARNITDAERKIARMLKPRRRR